MSTYTDVWLMEQEHVNAWNDQVALYEARTDYKMVDGEETPTFTHVQLSGSEAVVTMHGPMLTTVSPIMKFFGAEAVDMKEVGEVLLALDEKGLDLIRLDINSPGGDANGTEALSNIIRNLKTPVVAQVGGVMLSAALWVGLSAGTVEATTSTAMIGSLGVISVTVDSSKQAEKEGIEVHVTRSSELKGGTVPGTVITPEQKAESERINGQLFAVFKSAIAELRGMDEAQIEAVSTGQKFIAADAHRLGLIDSPVTPLNNDSKPLTADNLSAPQQEDSALSIKVEDAMKLCADFPAFADQAQKLVGEGKDEADIRATLKALDVNAKLSESVAKVETLTAQLKESEGLSSKFTALETENTELKAKVEKFEKFPEQATDAGPGSQSIATDASAEDKLETIEVPEGYEAKIADDGSQYLEMKEGAE